MTTPVTEPRPAFPPKAAPSSGPLVGPKPLKFLSTRNGQIAAAGGAVAAFALWKRHQASVAAAAGTSGTATGTATGSTSGAGVQGTADTTGSDLYNELEPLIENLSGFSGTQAIDSQLASNQAALLAAINAGKGTPPGLGIPGGKVPIAGKVLFPNQVHQVGKVGTTVDLKSYIAQNYKTANPQQQAEILYATVANDPSLGSGKIPGGKKVTLWSQAVK